MDTERLWGVKIKQVDTCFESKYLFSDSLKRMLNLNQPITKSTAVEPVWKVSLTVS